MKLVNKLSSIAVRIGNTFSDAGMIQTGNIFETELEEIEEGIEELYRQIKIMKCCGNCLHNNSMDYSVGDARLRCIGCKNYNHWEMF